MINRKISANSPTVRRWVWYSSKESVAAGKTSILALVEIPCAMALFWWIGWASSYPWWTWVGIVAAPTLLLRSKDSSALGEACVQWLITMPFDGQRVRILTAVCAAAIAFAVGFSLGSWVTTFRGVLGILAGGVAASAALIFALSLLISVHSFKALPTIAPVIVVLCSAFVGGALSGAGRQLALGSLVIFGLYLCVGALGRHDLWRYIGFPALFFLNVAMGLGLYARIAVLRIIVILVHPYKGFLQMPANWRETVAVIDARRPPEIVPGGHSEESYILNDAMRDFNFLNYILGILYRWNLKASAWLWWPLALLIKPPFNGHTDNAKAELIALTTKGFWATKREPLCYIVGVWLLTPSLPMAIADALGVTLKISDIVVTITELLAPPNASSARYWLLWLCVGLTWWLNKRAADYAALAPGFKDALKPARMADVERLRLWTTAAYVLTGWAFGLWFAQKRWPHLFGQIVWDWVTPWL